MDIKNISLDFFFSEQQWRGCLQKSANMTFFYKPPILKLAKGARVYVSVRVCSKPLNYY